MTHAKLAGILGISLLIGVAIAAPEGQARPEPVTFSLECAGGDCPLLKGEPQTGARA